MTQPLSCAVSRSFLQYFVYFHFIHCDVLINAKMFISWGGSGPIFISALYLDTVIGLAVLLSLCWTYIQFWVFLLLFILSMRELSGSVHKAQGFWGMTIISP